MKIIILLALAGVSLCQNDGTQPPPQEGQEGQGGPEGQGGQGGQGGQEGSSSTIKCNSEYKNDFANDKECFKDALKTVPFLMESGDRIVCKYRNIKEEQRKEYFDQFRTDLSLFLRCTGCGAGNLVGLEELLGKLGSDAGQTTGDVIEVFEGLKRALGIDKVGLGLLCYLLGGFLASDCAKRLISSDVSGVTGNLNSVLCTKEEELDVALTLRTLKDVGCLLDDTLRIDDVLADLTEGTGEALAPAVKDAISELKKDPLLGPVLQTLGCPVTKVVNNLINGDGNGLLPDIVGGGTGGGLLTNHLGLLGR